MPELPLQNKTWKQRLWRTIKIGLVVFSILAVVVVVRWQAGLWMARSAWNNAVKEFATHGHPMTFTELEALRDTVFPEENAAEVIEEYAKDWNFLVGGKRVMYFETETRRTSGSYFFAGIEPDALAESKAFYEKHRDLADRFSQLKGRYTGKSSFSYDFSDEEDITQVLLPSLSPCREANKFLRLQTALLLEEGKRQEAVDSCVLQFNSAASLDNDMSIISHLVQAACLRLCIGTVEDILRTGDLTPDQVEQLIHSVDHALEHCIPWYGLCFGLLFATASYDQATDKTLSCINFSLFNAWDLKPFIEKASEWQPGETIIQSKVVMLEWMLPFLNAAKNRDWKALREAPALLEKEEGYENIEYDFNTMTWKQKITFRPFDRYRLPNQSASSLDGLILQSLHVRGRLLCARTSLAVEQFRMQHGCFPETLDELVPAFLESVPLDPFDDQPLRYIHTEKGVVVYSVGRDEKDDGGVVSSWLDENGERQRAPDSGFRLYAPEHRGVEYYELTEADVSTNGVGGISP